MGLGLGVGVRIRVGIRVRVGVGVGVKGRVRVRVRVSRGWRARVASRAHHGAGRRRTGSIARGAAGRSGPHGAS